MTSIADLSSAWATTVFNHASVQAITPKALAYEVLDESEVEIGQISHQTEINFFEYLVTKSYRFPLIGNAMIAENLFTVDVRYTREKDTMGAAYLAAQEALEAVLERVRAGLGSQWNGLVDFWTVQEAAPTITQRNVADCECWSWILTFNANFRSLS